MNGEVFPRSIEFLSVLFKRSLDVFRVVDRGKRWKTLRTYIRIKLKSGLFVLVPSRKPDKERLFDWTVSIGNYSDFVFLFEEIFIVQSYKASLTANVPVIVDGGANIGLATLYFKFVYPNASITSIEPEPHAYLCLENNVMRNGLRDVTLHHKALGRTEGLIEFHYSSSRPASPLAGQNRFLGESTTIEVVPLSSLVNGPVDLVKLDVEGAETDVIKDLVETRAIDRIGSIYLEYHHHLSQGDDHLSEILALLENAGFGYQIMQARVGQPGDYQDLVLYVYPEKANLT
jgi:FkbM family methyltransferase